MSDTESISKRLEELYTSIYIECEGRLYYPPNEYQHIFQKIIRASSTLFHNALKRTQHHNVLMKTPDNYLTAERTVEFMQNIYHIIQDIDYPNIMEDKIRQLLQDNSLNPDDFLISNPSDEQEYIKAKILLNDAL